MIKKSLVGIFLICSLLLGGFQPVSGSSTLSIITDKKIYSYGEFFTFTIEVSEITEEFATLHIIDQSGKKSSAVPIPITDLKTVVPSPFPFEPTVYPLGKYTLEIQYSGLTETAEFELVDSGNIVIPMWIREFAKFWYNGAISDIEFASGIEFLIKEGIIVVPTAQTEESPMEVKIPSWVKFSTGWWIDRIISDTEYADSLEYLIKVGIIQV